MAQFTRRESPPHFHDYRLYRAFLRRDFRQRCAYCERSEARLGGDEHFEIDHFRPQKLFREQITEYGNLYYACGKCNRTKGQVWPSDASLATGFRFADPCQEDMYVQHLREENDGELQHLTNCGLYSCDQIRLNRPALIEWRRQRRQASAEVAVYEQLVTKLELLLKDVCGIDNRSAAEAEIDLIRATIVRARQANSL